MSTYIHHKFLLESPYSSKDFFNFISTSQLPRHRWYFFKEGFSAALVKEAIHRYNNGSEKYLNILDPFCGSGTTLLTSASLGHYATGIEVNPFLAFVSKVKSLPEKWQRTDYIEKLNNVIIGGAEECESSLESFSTFCERDNLEKWLFNKNVLRKFTALDGSINKYAGIYKSPFKLALLVAALECCNAKRDGKGLRYKKNWKSLTYSGSDVLRQFQERALVMIDDVENYPISLDFKPSIICGDARESITKLADNHFDLIVTSPPYLNSFDYSDVYRPELFLGGYVCNNEQLSVIRRNTIRSHIQVNWSRETFVQSDLLDPIVEQIAMSKELWDYRIPLMVTAYFDDLDRILTGIYNKLKKEGQIWLVVSTSAYAGVHIPVDLIIADLAEKTGYVLKEIHCLRELRTSGQQWKSFNTKRPPLRESLVIMKKP